MRLQDARQLAMFDVAGDADADFGDEDKEQEHRECQNHAARLAKCTAAAEERDNENHWPDNHQHNRSCPKGFADEVFIVVIRVLNNGTDHDD